MRVFSFGTESFGLRMIFLILMDFILLILALLGSSLGQLGIVIRIITPIFFVLSAIYVTKELNLIESGFGAEMDIKWLLKKLPQNYMSISDFVDEKKVM